MDGLREHKLSGAELESALALLPAMIASESEFFVEGGAYLAGKHRRTECVPALIASLEREKRSTKYWNPEPTRCLLDALIRLDARVSADLLLTRPKKEFASQTYLLLAKADPPDLEGLVRFFDLGWDSLSGHWASACTLVAAGEPRVVEPLLIAQPWPLEFVVRDPDSLRGMTFCCRGGAHRSSHPVWPPRVLYNLKLPRTGSADLEVGFSRSEYATGWWNDGLSEVQDQLEWRLRLLERQLGSLAPDFRERLTADHAFEDNTGFLEALDRSADAVLAPLHDAIHRAAELNMISDVDAVTKQLRVRITLVDHRSEPASPLPRTKKRANVEFVEDR